MADSTTVERRWFVDVVPDEVRIRCFYQRRRKRIIQYTVQLETAHGGRWCPVLRYDNAHGFCHRDTIHADGTQHKTPVYYGDANETFTLAIEDLRANWQAHQARFLKELKR